MLWIRRVALASIVLAVMLLAAEFAARRLPGAKDASHFEVTPWLKSDFYRVAPRVGYEIIPNVSEQVNALGMRGTERPEKKPEGGFRVLVLGDSIAYGVGVSMTDTFAAKLEDRLRAEVKDRYVDVLNAGVSGYNTSQQLAVLESRLERHGPDVVVLSYCPNDIDSTPMLFKAGDEFCFYCVGAEPRLYPAWWIENSALFRRVVVAREAAFRSLTEKDRSRTENLAALREMATKLAAAKIPFVVVIFPYLLESLKKYPPQNVELHREVKSIVDGAGGMTIDFLPIWLDRDHRSLRNRLDAADYVHPNEDGHREAADLLAGALLPRLR